MSAPFKPFVPPEESPPELTFAPLLLGSLLGVVFGASSVYLVLKVGLTVSASIPVAVLAFALFRGLAAVGMRRATVLENNTAQTAGSAGESIAFGVGLVMPALLVLGFDIDVVRVMTVGVLGGLLGILMMIPLRRAFVVNQHGTLKYPEGTACADVLIAGEKGGRTAGVLFAGLGLGFVYQFVMLGLKLWKDTPGVELARTTAAGKTVGLKAGVLNMEMSAPLLGVGYIIGPRIAGIMAAGGVLAYLVLVPTIAYFGERLDQPLPPAMVKDGLIRDMSVGKIRTHYILYIGAGAVAAGGLISMMKALPVIVASVAAGFRDLRGGRGQAGTLRTERDLPMSVVLVGSLGMVAALAAAPSLGLGLNPAGIAGAFMVLLFGFLFVTVSSRLTGEIGSSSNPISGMTVATLLLTCLILVGLGEIGVLAIGKETKLLALTVAGVVCIACSNGGTTSQALKTGHLLGATPLYQQYAILVGSLTSALVVGVVLLMLNDAGTVYSKRNLPAVTLDAGKLTATDTVRVGEYTNDTSVYKVLTVGKGQLGKLDRGLVTAGNPDDVPAGKYLVADDGRIVYRVDPAVNGVLPYEDREADKPEAERKPARKFDAPKTQLVALIIDGVLDGELPWGLVLIGVLIAVTLELCGVPSLPFAVGVYLPLAASTPILFGGLLRWLADKLRGVGADDGDSSPGVLLSSGYIAGGSLAALAANFLVFRPTWEEGLDLSKVFPAVAASDLTPTLAFGLLAVVLLWVGRKR